MSGCSAIAFWPSASIFDTTTFFVVRAKVFQSSFIGVAHLCIISMRNFACVVLSDTSAAAYLGSLLHFGLSPLHGVAGQYQIVPFWVMLVALFRGHGSPLLQVLFLCSDIELFLLKPEMNVNSFYDERLSWSHGENPANL